MSNFQLSHMLFDQLSNREHDIYLYGKLSTKLLAKATNKNAKLMFMKTEWLLFS